MQAVILAGGKGTRLQSLLKGKPKCLAPIGQKTILEHQIIEITKSNIQNILIICCYESQQVINHINQIKDNYKSLNISVFVEDYPGGTGGALAAALNKLNKDFLLIMGDLFISLNLPKIYNFGRKCDSDALLVCKYTDHPEDSDLIGLMANNYVKNFFLRDENRNQIMHNKIPPIGNSGVFYFKKEFIKTFCTELCDIHQIIFSSLSNKVKLPRINYFFTAEFIKDLGSVERLSEVNKLNLLPYQMDSRIKSPAIFLDKDNTIIKDPKDKNPRNIKIDLFNRRLINLLVKLNKTHRIFITTNQPGIAKGFFKEDDLVNHLFTLGSHLFSENINISGFYFCPHHPQKGFENEIKELKISCNCRKPNPGMCEKISSEFNIEFEKSFVIGDSIRDFQLAKNMNIKFINALQL